MILETDVPTNPGDSGGPVLNDRGQLVGVISHYAARQRQVSGNIDLEEVRNFVAQDRR
jgi:S1-C subfamily serine protease